MDMRRIELSTVFPEKRATGASSSSGANGLPALAALVISLGSIPFYFALLDVPLFRSSGLPAIVGMGIGVVVSLWAARRDGRRWVRGVTGLNIFVVVLWLVAFFWMALLPKPADAAFQLTQAPDFELPDHTGRKVSLQAAYAAGPVLLVFYRGHW
jgi:hypothetical protein